MLCAWQAWGSFEEFRAKVDKKKISCDFVALKEGEVKCHNFTILGHINVSPDMKFVKLFTLAHF